MIPPAYVLTPEIVAQLTPAERIILAYRASIWARPEQRIPPGDWRLLGVRAGRGWGKTTLMIAPEINRRVEAGEATSIALMGPNEDRVDAVQIAALIETAPPWFRPERYRGGIRWPNGVHALAFSAETPRGAAGGTYDLAWCTELVAWDRSNAMKAWMTLAEAVRKPGTAAQMMYDSTNSGQNALLSFLERDHERDPVLHRVVNGSTFDNPMLSRKYLRSVCSLYPVGSRRFREELMGESFAESACALWQWAWIEANRRPQAPTAYDIKIVSIDPAQSDRADADETGIVVACRDSRGEIYVLDDLSGRFPAQQWATRIVDVCEREGASGIVTERNNSGDPAHDLVKVIAEQRGMRVEDLNVDTPFPARTPGRIYFKAYTSTRAKHQRAEGPAALYSQGRVHHVGVFDTLETQMTTWEPDNSKSPDRLDALSYAVAELASLRVAAATAVSDLAVGLSAHSYLRDAQRRAPSRRVM